MIGHLLVAVLLAQILNPLESVQAYITADPINPDRLGLATPDGRYAITTALGGGCDELSPPLAVGQNILIYPNYEMPPWLAITEVDSVPPDGCMVRVEGRMSATPCFTNDDGVCDIAAESDQ